MNTGSLEQIVELIRQKAGGYIAVNRTVNSFGADFESELANWLTTSESFYSIFVAIPDDIVMSLEENINRVSVRVFSHGTIQEDRQNVASVVSDTALILGDLWRDLFEDRSEWFELEGDGQVYAENNSRLDICAGCWVQMDFIVTPVTACQIAKRTDYGV